MPTKRTVDRVANTLGAIARLRADGVATTRECLAFGKNHLEVKGSWPLHALENRSPSTSIRPPIEGEARMAFARQNAGLPLTERDIYVLERYPDGGPWQSDWEEAAREYKQAVHPQD